ncbi:MAG: hypothetical protein GXO71_07290 [Caldiserica bacterium]|nr:hypothetical protein [Caldisericota bacterium]
MDSKKGWFSPRLMILAMGFLLVGGMLPVPFIYGYETRSLQNVDNSAQEIVSMMKEINKLKHRISFWNLFNGLNLSQDQIEELIAINTEYREKLRESTAKAIKALSESRVSLEKWEQAIRDGNLPEERMRQAGRASHITKEFYQQLKDIKEPFLSRLNNVFTDAQKEVIRGFKPCVVPPTDLRDPIRVGQASSNEYAVRMLKRIRSIPSQKFPSALDRIVDIHADKISRRYRLTDNEIEQERQRMRDFLKKVYYMDDVDFEMNKEELADEFKYKDKVELLREDLRNIQQELHRTQKVRDPVGTSKIVRYFLDPEIIPLLQYRLNLLRSSN